jgi:DnaJ-domain-containing protein 1
MKPQMDACPDLDPAVVLGVSPDASDQEIRDAYVSLVKQHPPDRSPAEFERIRDAYEILRDPRSRARQRMFGSGDPKAPLTRLLDRSPPPRCFVGPAVWLAALAED